MIWISRIDSRVKNRFPSVSQWCRIWRKCLKFSFANCNSCKVKLELFLVFFVVLWTKRRNTNGIKQAYSSGVKKYGKHLPTIVTVFCFCRAAKLSMKIYETFTASWLSLTFVQFRLKFSRLSDGMRVQIGSIMMLHTSGGSKGGQILSISCGFWGNLAKSYVAPPRGLAHPPHGNPGSATAYIA